MGLSIRLVRSLSCLIFTLNNIYVSVSVCFHFRVLPYTFA